MQERLVQEVFSGTGPEYSRELAGSVLKRASSTVNVSSSSYENESASGEKMNGESS